MGIERDIRTAVDTGKVVLGARKTLKMAMNGGAKLIIVASNCPADSRTNVEHYAKLSKTPLHIFDGSSMELGSVCGKQFTISMLTIKEPGDSMILEHMRKKRDGTS